MPEEFPLTRETSDVEAILSTLHPAASQCDQPAMLMRIGWEAGKQHAAQSRPSAVGPLVVNQSTPATTWLTTTFAALSLLLGGLLLQKHASSTVTVEGSRRSISHHAAEPLSPPALEVPLRSLATQTLEQPPAQSDRSLHGAWPERNSSTRQGFTLPAARRDMERWLRATDRFPVQRHTAVAQTDNTTVGDLLQTFTNSSGDRL